MTCRLLLNDSLIFLTTYFLNLNYNSMEGVMAVITCFAGDFAPKNWATCDGQIMSISTNQALFSLLGTTYGGNGVQTFGLPDLRGRAPVCTGQGPGLSNYNLGQVAGSEFAFLTATNLAPHNHNGPVTLSLPASSDDATEPTPNDGYPGRFTGMYATTAPDTTMLAPAYTPTIQNAGNGAGVDIRSPFLAINHVICLYGIFPSRN
jgi:microcystin-dependent protein